MASKKDFSKINTGNRVLSSMIDQATSEKGRQGSASPEEMQERAAQLKTQGRKGCKAIRINMAFTPENHQFIKIISSASGQTMTQFTNYCIETYRKDHPEIVTKANEFINML